DWGFILAGQQDLNPQKIKFSKECRYLDQAILEKMFYFEQDIGHPNDIEINRLDQPVLLDYFLKDFEKWRKDKKQ
ncbi:hypothetical protein OAF63_06330, partial [Saprospiraceae bacterium]|nr:hypothetical protein [Saprospiraceae bacterium]